jgi:hypothetical protein
VCGAQQVDLWSLIEPLINRFDDAPEIIFHLLEHVTAMQAELIATIWWSIWKSRNLNLWQQVTENNSNIVARAKHTLELRRNANKKQQSQHIQSGNAAAVTLQTAGQGSAKRNVTEMEEANAWKARSNATSMLHFRPPQIA